MYFSTECTRLAVGHYDGDVIPWDMRDIDASGLPSKENTIAVTALALSRDCSGLASGFVDGTVELWGTNPLKRRIPIGSKMKAVFSRIFRRSHKKLVWALGFDPDGKLFASGSENRTIKLWNGGTGALRRILKTPGGVQAVALSNRVLVATWGGWHKRVYDNGITLWSLDTLRPIHTFGGEASKVSIAENSTLIAVEYGGHVSLLDVVNRTIMVTFDVPPEIHTMTFLPDNSQLVVQFRNGVLLSLNLIHKHVIQRPTLEHLIQLPNTPLVLSGQREALLFSVIFST